MKTLPRTAWQMLPYLERFRHHASNLCPLGGILPHACIPQQARGIVWIKPHHLPTQDTPRILHGLPKAALACSQLDCRRITFVFNEKAHNRCLQYNIPSSLHFLTCHWLGNDHWGNDPWPLQWTSDGLETVEGKGVLRHTSESATGSIGGTGRINSGSKLASDSDPSFPPSPRRMSSSVSGYQQSEA